MRSGKEWGWLSLGWADVGSGRVYAGSFSSREHFGRAGGQCRPTEPAWFFGDLSLRAAYVTWRTSLWWVACAAPSRALLVYLDNAKLELGYVSVWNGSLTCILRFCNSQFQVREELCGQSFATNSKPSWLMLSQKCSMCPWMSLCYVVVTQHGDPTSCGVSARMKMTRTFTW